MSDNESTQAEGVKEFPIPRLLKGDGLEDRYTLTVLQRTWTTALSVMLLGCVEQGNRLLDVS